MKNLILNIFLLSISVIGNAQISTNTSVETAVDLCNIEPTVETGFLMPFNIPESGGCSSNTKKLYYTGNFRITDANATLVVSIVGNNVAVPITLHGPFTTYTEGIQAIQANSSIGGTINNMTIVGTSGGPFPMTNTSTTQNIYIVEVSTIACSGSVQIVLSSNNMRRLCSTALNTCQDCIKRFQPTNAMNVAGKNEYVVSAWVKVVKSPQVDTITSYAYNSVPTLVVNCANASDATQIPTTAVKLAGPIIDGWQKMEGLFNLPDDAGDLPAITISMTAAAGTKAYFDDIRFFPNDGSMMSYVYDPVTFRLVAELDERNYATMYEYDEEGKLVRVKKETEAGIMTIQENRENSFKRP
jgi:hypothetical protein